MEKLKITELIQICKEKNIKGYSKKKKEELIKLIEEIKEKDPLIESLSNLSIKEEVKDKLFLIDLCAGTGAFSHAFEKTGKVKAIFSNDIMASSEKIYNENFSHKLTLKDICEIKNEEIPSHDILTGGFPCQNWSIAGKQKGFEDERADVFWKICSILDHHNPKCFVLENVKNLLSHNNGESFKVVIKSLEEKGYFVKYKVLNTAKITGVPQHRERVYIIGVKDKDIFDKLDLNFEDVPKRSILEFLEDKVASKYYYTEKSSIWNMLKEEVKDPLKIYQFRRVYVRENKSGECPTLTANMGTGGHNVPIIFDGKGIRKLTPKECFNFQGFPKEYKLPNLSDAGLYKLAGNAVSVPVVNRIAERLLSFF